MKKILTWILLALMLVTPALAEESEPQLPAIPGMEAPDFELTLLNGETFKLSEQRGKVVLLNVWATWCGPCVAEMPELEQLAKDYADDLVVIGINCGEPEETVAEFVAENEYTYLFAADEEYLISGFLYPSYSIPNTFIIDADGIVTEIHTGGGKGMYEVFEQLVLDAMGDQPEILA